MNLEIFSCSGGMAEGFRRAGITFDVVIDKDPNAVASYEANLDHRPIQMDAKDLLRLLAHVDQLEVDLLVADPPCTPWSMAGKRKGTEDERDMLVETCAIVRALKPRCWLIANVPGLDAAPNWPTVQSTIGALSELGYTISYASLDAADYGVPQHRVRPFWFGSFHPEPLSWPAPSHHDPRRGETLFGHTQPWVTCRQALEHLPAEELGTPVKGRKGKAPNPGQFNKPSELDAPARTGRSARNDYVRVDDPKHPPSRAGAPAKTICGRQRSQSGTILERWWADRPATTIYAGTNQLAAPGKGSPMSRGKSQSQRAVELDAPAPTVMSKQSRNGQRIWPWDRPSTTVCSDDRIEPPGHHGPSHKSTAGYVRISEKAGLILQGFPEDWTVCGKTKSARWSQIGQAIPPPLAEAVARAIVAHMEKGS